MSTKLLTGDDAAPAEPVTWRALDEGGVIPSDGAPSAEPPSRAVAQANAEELQARIAELEKEIPLREQQAFAGGYKKGEAAGLQQGAAQYQPAIEQLARTVKELAQLRRKFRRDAEQDVVKLALAIGKRIVHRELSIDAGAVLGVVKAALEKLEGREVDKVRLCPQDVEAVRAHLGKIPGPAIELIPDAKLARGSAIFETARGNLDASVETQLEEIQRGLADRIR